MEAFYRSREAESESEKERLERKGEEKDRSVQQMHEQNVELMELLRVEEMMTMELEGKQRESERKEEALAGLVHRHQMQSEVLQADVLALSQSEKRARAMLEAATDDVSAMVVREKTARAQLPQLEQDLRRCKAECAELTAAFERAVEAVEEAANLLDRLLDHGSEKQQRIMRLSRGVRMLWMSAVSPRDSELKELQMRASELEGRLAEEIEKAKTMSAKVDEERKTSEALAERLAEVEEMVRGGEELR
eukprot:1391893-Rhodomonas_salina.1